jgi:hypothetical protein
MIDHETKQHTPTSERKRRRRMRRDPFGRLALAVGDYLDAVGWKALVVGDPRIQQPLDAPEFAYELVVRFTGGRKKERGPAPEAETKVNARHPVT